MSRSALLIGTDSYENADLPPLSAPASDIERLARVLRDPEIGDFDEVAVMINRPSNELAEAIEDLAAGKTPDDLILLYLSCHGLKDPRHGRLHFAAVNTKINRLGATSISASWVNDQLGNCTNADSRVLLLDCCYSGAFAEGFASKSGNETILNDICGAGYIVMTASDSISPAFEDAVAEGRSIFTDVLIAGMISGDADKDGDGFVSTTDLFDYAFPLVTARSPQRPNYHSANLEGKVILAKARRREKVVLSHTARGTASASEVASAKSSTAPTAKPTLSEGSSVYTWEDHLDRVSAVVEKFSLSMSAFPNFSGHGSGSNEEIRISPALGGPSALAARLIAVDSSALSAVVRLIASSHGHHPALQSGADEHESVARGWRAASHGWWEEAQTQFGSAVRNEPLSFAAWWGMGCCYGVANAWSRAADSFTKAARYASINSAETAAGATLLAAAAMDLGGLAGADRVLLSALSKAPDFPELMVAVAIRTSDYRLLAKAVTVDPAFAIVLGAAEFRLDADTYAALSEVADNFENEAIEISQAWASARELASDFMVPLPPQAQRQAGAEPLGRILASIGDILEIRARASTIERSLTNSAAQLLTNMRNSHVDALRKAHPGKPPSEPQGWFSILKAKEWDSYRAAMKKYDASVVAHEEMNIEFRQREEGCENLTPIRDVLLAVAGPFLSPTRRALILQG